MKLKDISETFHNEFSDPEYVALYLKEALNSNGMNGFLLALRNIVVETEGMTQIAQETELGRESLYKTLSENGNPQFITIYKIISALGLEISFQPTSETANLS
jgi:probable addiction module antidote protein